MRMSLMYCKCVLIMYMQIFKSQDSMHLVTIAELTLLHRCKTSMPYTYRAQYMSIIYEKETLFQSSLVAPYRLTPS